MHTMALWSVFPSGLILLVTLVIQSMMGSSRLEEPSTNSEKHLSHSTDSLTKTEPRNNSSDIHQTLKPDDANSLMTVRSTHNRFYLSIETRNRLIHNYLQEKKDEKSRKDQEQPNSQESLRQSCLAKLLLNRQFKLKRYFSRNQTSKENIQHPKLRSNHERKRPSKLEEMLSISALFGQGSERVLTKEELWSSTKNETRSTIRPEFNESLTSCIPVEGYHDHERIMVVSFCPKDWTNQTVRYLCKEALNSNYIMSDTPVQDAQGIVYANRFCARCNNVDKIQTWKIAWTCENHNPLAGLFQRTSSSDVMNMVTSMRYDKSCQMMRSPAVPDVIQPCVSDDSRDDHLMPMVNAQDRLFAGSGYPVSLNILINFDFSGKTHIMFADYYADENFETPPMCPAANYVWDADVGQCRELVCHRGYHFDDTFTSCIQDDGPVLDSQDEIITDLSQIVLSTDIERVTLRMEIPGMYVPLFNASGYDDLWKSQIANQLNITISRIQMFNLSVEVASGEGNTLVIEKLSDENSGQASEDDSVEKQFVFNKTLSTEPLDGQGKDAIEDSLASDQLTKIVVTFPTVEYTTNFPPKTFAKHHFPTSSLSSEHTRQNSSSSLLSKDDVTITSLPSNGDLLKPTSSNPSSLQTQLTKPSLFSRLYESFTTSSLEKNTTQDITVIISFILMPPESQLSGQSSGPLVEELSSLVSKGELHFTINGTSLKVEKMDQEDKPSIYSPPCPHGLLVVLDGEQIRLLYQSTNTSGNNITMLMDLSSGKIYKLGMFDISMIIIQPIGNTTQEPETIVFNALGCEMPYNTNSRCKRIRIKAEEYTIDKDGKILTFQNSTYNISSYEFVDDSYQEVEICVPESYSETMVFHPSRVLLRNCASGFETWLKVEGYLTAVLGRISMAALCTVLLTYCLFSKLRNLPGVNTMNLTFALFLAEVIFITGEQVQVRWLCTAVAASLHYCFLASQCWMNVMSYDVYRTFAGSTCILTRVRDKKFFPRYALYAWGVPFLVIGACLFIDLSHVFPGISIGYGGTWANGLKDSDLLQNISGKDSFGTKRAIFENDEKFEQTNATDGATDMTSFVPRIGDHSFSCWIQKPLAAMFAFGAPIFVIFLMNCAFFSKTIISIQRTNRLTRHSGIERTHSSNTSRKLSGHKDVILYVKMSTVMGFTWVFALASTIVSAVAKEPSDVICYVLHVLGVFFPILNSSQGLFIFFAFVFNRRVLNLYRALPNRFRIFFLAQKKKMAVFIGHMSTTDIATITDKVSRLR